MKEDSLGTSGIEADLFFHRAILVASHKPLAAATAHRISSESFVVFLFMHEAVFDAIAKRNGDRALSQTQRSLATLQT